MSKLKTFGLVVIVIVVIVGFGLAGLTAVRVYRWFFPYLDRDIAGPTTISSEWVEIVPTEPLRAYRDTQYLMLDIKPPVRLDSKSFGLLLPDESVVVPQIQLIDEDGKTYTLNPVYGFGGDNDDIFATPLSRPWEYGFAARDDLPKNKVLRRIRLRCDKPIKCARIYWRCYDPWDVK